MGTHLLQPWPLSSSFSCSQNWKLILKDFSLNQKEKYKEKMVQHLPQISSNLKWNAGINGKLLEFLYYYGRGLFQME